MAVRGSSRSEDWRTDGGMESFGRRHLRDPHFRISDHFVMGRRGQSHRTVGAEKTTNGYYSSFVRVPLRQLVFFFPPYLDRKRYSTPVKMTSCKQQSVLPYRRMLVHRITIRRAMKTMTSRPIGLTLNQIVGPVSRRERKIP